MPSRRRLLATTALYGCAGLMLMLSSPALAANFTVTTGTTDTSAKTMGGTDTGVVQAGGTLQTSSTAVTQSGSASNVTLTNAGTIASTGGRGFDTSGGNTTRTITITNQAGALIRSDVNDALRVNTNITSGSVTIDNAGTIRAAAPTDPTSTVQGQALDLRGMNSSGVSLTVINRATGVIEALNDDALRPGLNATVENYGIIRSFGANTSGGNNGTADGIDAGGRTGITVTNRAGGLISGARHGITADTDITVVNEAGGSIIGRNGSGVGSDGNGTVTNYGLISGDYAGVGNIFNSSGVASVNGDGDGVDIDFIGTVTNYGTIRGTGAGGVDSGGRPNGADGIAMGGGTIVNHAGAVIFGAAHGIMVDDGADGSAYGATTITNDGTIQGGTGAAITLVGPYNDTVTTSGSIIGGGASPVAIDFGAGDDKLIILGGTITGAVKGGDGTDSIEVRLGGGNSMTLTNATPISGFETATVTSGTLRIDSALGLATSLTVASAGTLAGGGSVTVPTLAVAGTVAPGGASGTLSATGNVSFAAGSHLQVAITPDGQSSKLAVTGTTAIDSGATVQVAPTDGLYTVARSYTILTASGGVTGGFGAVERVNGTPLGSSTLSLSQTGTTVTLTLNPGNPFNGARNSVNIAGQDIGYNITGASASDTLTVQGTSTARGDMANLALLQVGTSGGDATALTLAAGAQTVTAVAVKPNARLSVGSKLTSPTVAVDAGGALTIDSTGSATATSTTLATGSATTVNGTLTTSTLALDNGGALTIVNGGSAAATSATLAAGSTTTVNGTLTSTALTIASGATLNGSGSITGAVTNAGTLSPGNSPGVLTVSGSVTETSTSVLHIDVDGTTAGIGAGHYDQINVTGTPGTFTAAGTLEPVTRGITGSATNSYTPTIGQGYTIVTATGGVSGSFSSLTQPTSGMAAGSRFDVVYGSNAITLYATPNSYANLAAAGVAATGNQNAVGAAVQAIRPAAGTRPSDSLKPLFDALYPLSASAAASALDQLGGVVHAEAVTAARDANRLFGDALFARTAAVRADGLARAMGAMTTVQADGGKSAANGTPTDGSASPDLWARALGNFANSNGDGTTEGFKRRSGGVALGGDHQIAPNLTVGGAVGYLRTAVDAKGGLGRTDIDNYSAALYGTYSVGSWFVEGQASYAYGHYDSNRTITIGGANALSRSADGSSHGNSVGAALNGGYVWNWQGARIEPAAGLRIDRVVRHGFTETGAGALGLTVDEADLTTLRSSLGARVSWSLKAGETLLEPELRARWDHDFLDVAADSGASLSGAAFTVAGTHPGRDAAVLGAGVAADLGDRFQAFGSYDAELRRDAVGHTLTAGLRYRW